MAVTTFAAGCFWGVEQRFAALPGVLGTEVGYTGGATTHPTYEQVCSHTTGHAEAVRVEYDPEQISYERLLDAFFGMHDPTTPDRQGPDIGSQYRSAVFYHSAEQERAARDYVARLESSGRHGEPVVTEIAPAPEFWRAEEYHQCYLEKRGRGGCLI